MPSKGKKHATRSKKYAKGTPRTNPGFRKKVLSVIKRTQEVKLNVQSQDSQGIQFYDQTTPSNMTYLDLNAMCISQIQQGTDNLSRIGTKISIRSWVIKGSIVSNATANRPFYVKAIVLKSKTNKDYSTALFDDLYERPGAGGTPQPISTLSDIYTPIDKDNYTVYAMRVFKLGNSTSTSNPNNDFSVSRMFSINMTKHFKKFEWGDTGNGALPTSPNNLYMIFVGCNADNTNVYGGASNTWNGPSSQYSWTSTVRFTDD